MAVSVGVEQRRRGGEKREIEGKLEGKCGKVRRVIMESGHEGGKWEDMVQIFGFGKVKEVDFYLFVAEKIQYKFC